MTIQPDQTNVSIADLVVNAIEDPATRRKHIGIAAKIVGHANAEDIVQDSYLKAFHTRERFVERQLNAWLTRIVINTAIEYWKKKKPIYLNPNKLQYGRRDATQDLDLQNKEFWQHMNDFANSLSETNRRRVQMVLLYHCLDMEYKQICEIFGVPRGTVMSSMYRGRRVLRSELEDMHDHYSPKQKTSQSH